jgi:hypothetical protein
MGPAPTIATLFWPFVNGRCIIQFPSVEGMASAIFPEQREITARIAMRKLHKGSIMGTQVTGSLLKRNGSD